LRIAITGASGLVGTRLCGLLAGERHEPIGVVRSEAGARRVRDAGGLPVSTALEPVGLTQAFHGAHAVVHLAQIGRQTAGSSFETVNLGGTRAVMQAAAAAGVRRLVYFSGLGVAHYGKKRHCTNAYFLSKLLCEAGLLRSGIETIVFRPSYVVGPGGEFLPGLLRDMQAGEVECVGDGEYRLQPIALRDAAAALLAALERPAGATPFVYDLVGPEALSYNHWLERLVAVAGRSAGYRVRQVPVEVALQRARERGELEELDCLLCDESSDPAPLESLLGRFLTPLDEALRQALPGLS